jgi:hypothetical protein
MDNNIDEMLNVKRQTAIALSPLLSIFETIDGLTLRGVKQRTTNDIVDTILFQLEESFLTIKAMSDDTVTIFLESGYGHGTAINDVQPWATNIGKSIGWNWVAVNQQGYMDSVLISFGCVVPEIAIFAVASGLQVHSISRL